jgi:ligand-binding SRPBCC domain-containing protein
MAETMSIHTLQTTQILHTDLATAWEFFSNPQNLSRITPAHLNFKIISTLPPRIHPGMMIEYRVHPLLGIPMTWLTEITHVADQHRFVDEQRVGPYRMWHHEHTFRALDSQRVEMTDKVTYIVPFGLLGDLVHPIIVRPQLDQIFRYREKVVTQIFGPPTTTTEPALTTA